MLKRPAHVPVSRMCRPAVSSLGADPISTTILAAHEVDRTEHDAAAGWRYQALLMVAEWCQRRHPRIDVELDGTQDHFDSDRHAAGPWST